MTVSMPEEKEPTEQEILESVIKSLLHQAGTHMNFGEYADTRNSISEALRYLDELQEKYPEK